MFSRDLSRQIHHTVMAARPALPARFICKAASHAIDRCPFLCLAVLAHAFRLVRLLGLAVGCAEGCA